MPDPRRLELDELINRPGTYFNPQTEVLLVIDDSPSLDTEIFNMEEFEGADWVLISDETPIEEHQRDELLERFQVRHSTRARRSTTATTSTTIDELEPDEEDPESGSRPLRSLAAGVEQRRALLHLRDVAPGSSRCTWCTC